MAKRKKRVSGTGLKGGEAYTVLENGVWHADISAVKLCIEKYIMEAAGSGKYSLAGLCIYLGITREKLTLWRSGYFLAQDRGDACIAPNTQLAECVEMGLLYLQQHWEESDKPSALHVKQLEATGAFSDNSGLSAKPPFDLGRLKKFAR